MKTFLTSLLIFLSAIVTAQPVISSVSLTNLTSTQATFNAVVNANGLSTVVRLYWWKDATVNQAGTLPGNTNSPITGNLNTAVSRTVPTSGGGGLATALTPNTTYNYYFEGTYNTNQTVRTATYSFTTPALNATDSVYVASGSLTNSGFTLQWNAVSEKTYIQRITTGFPTGTANGTNVFNAVGTSLVQSGLTTGTTYYYRIWSASTNNVNTTFSTASKYFAVTVPGGSSISLAVPSSVSAGFDLSGYGAKILFNSTGTVSGSLTFSKTNDRPVNGYNFPENGYSLRGLTVLNEIAPVYWTISAANLTNFNYDLSLDYSGLPGITDDSSLVVVQRNNSDSQWTSAVNNSTSFLNKESSSFLTVSSLTSFSEFSFASDKFINSLPVELSSFTALSDNGMIVLNWSTAAESNNAGWEVESRIQNSEFSSQKSGSSVTLSGVANPSADLIEGWTKVAFVAGKGSTTEKQDYQFQVESSKFNSTGLQFRLKQIDLDGKYSYSQILTVNLTPNHFELSQNYPNPFNPVTVISYQLSAVSDVRLVVFDLLGREVERLVNEKKDAGNYSVNFSGSHLPSGVYFYKLSAGNFYEIKKMMLVK